MISALLEIDSGLALKVRGDNRFDKLVESADYYKIPFNYSFRHVFVWENLAAEKLNEIRYYTNEENTNHFMLLYQMDNLEVYQQGYLKDCHCDAEIKLNLKKQPKVIDGV